MKDKGARVILTCDNKAENNPVDLQMEGNPENIIQLMSCGIYLFLEQMTHVAFEATIGAYNKEAAKKSKEDLLRMMTGNVLAMINGEDRE